MTYEWSVKNNEGEVIQTFNEPNPKFTFEDIGAYDISLKVTDSQGESSEARMEVVAGNERLRLSIWILLIAIRLFSSLTYLLTTKCPCRIKKMVQCPKKLFH